MIRYCYRFNIVVNDNIEKAVISACHIISLNILQPNITFNPFTATSSDALHNASEKTFYQITHMIHLLETIYNIIPYRPGKPKTFLD